VCAQVHLSYTPRLDGFATVVAGIEAVGEEVGALQSYTRSFDVVEEGLRIEISGSSPEKSVGDERQQRQKKMILRHWL